MSFRERMNLLWIQRRKLRNIRFRRQAVQQMVNSTLTELVLNMLRIWTRRIFTNSFVQPRNRLGAWLPVRMEYGSRQELVLTFSKALAADLGVDADPDVKQAEDSDDLIIAKKGAEAKITLNVSDDGFSKTATVNGDGARIKITDVGGFSMDFMLKNNTEEDVKIEVTDIGAMSIQIGANQYQDMDVRIPEVSSESLYLDKVDVTVVGGPEDAMNRLDEAITKLNEVRSRIGAFTNRLEYASNSLAETHEDMTNAYSGILDTDMAEEMTEYTQQNVLEQATVSVLAQANDLPEKVLSLLQ